YKIHNTAKFYLGCWGDTISIKAKLPLRLIFKRLGQPKPYRKSLQVRRKKGLAPREPFRQHVRP
ncbi:MAG: hypothetical protein P8H37_10945, partial [Paracoccaceae bacterium]|nr:hypothetical protein [Paracoccaceae bacterium]